MPRVNQRALATLDAWEKRGATFPFEVRRGRYTLTIDQPPEPVLNTAGDLVGVDAVVRLFRGSYEVPIDGHRIFINPPGSLPDGRGGLLHDPTEALIHAVIESIALAPNSEMWRKPRGTVTTVYASTADGQIQSLDATYANARSGAGTFVASDNLSTMQVGQSLSGVYFVWEGFVSFDTTSVLSDTVTAADVGLWLVTDNSATDFILEARAKAWLSGGLTNADFVAGASLGGQTLLASIDTNGIGSTGAYKTLTSQAALLTAIATGSVEMVLASSRQRNGDTPSGAEYLTLSTADETGSTQDPKLTITHTSAVTVTKDVTSSAAISRTATKDVTTAAAMTGAGSKSVTTTAVISIPGVTPVSKDVTSAAAISAVVSASVATVAAITIIIQAPSLIPRRIRPARCYVHAPAWPFQRIGELRTARNIDRAWSLMQPGILALNISRSEEIDRDVLRTSNILVIESEVTAPWVGYLLTAEEDLGAGEIEITGQEMTAALDVRLTSASDKYDDSISSGRIFQQIGAAVNGRAFTGLSMPASSLGAIVEDVDLAAQTMSEALDELHDRTGNEWWADYSVRPQRVEATLRWGTRQGFDLADSVHLYEGYHFAKLVYRQDATRSQESATAFGGVGAPSGRAAVTRTAGAARGSFGGLIEAASAAAVRAIADLPPGLRSERAVLVPTTSNEAELSREARQALEKPLGSAEQFSAVVNGLIDWHLLALGNTVTINAYPKLRPTSRKMRIVGVQPDEESGVNELILEVVA